MTRVRGVRGKLRERLRRLTISLLIPRIPTLSVNMYYEIVPLLEAVLVQVRYSYVWYYTSNRIRFVTFRSKSGWGRNFPRRMNE